MNVGTEWLSDFNKAYDSTKAKTTKAKKELDMIIVMISLARKQEKISWERRPRDTRRWDFRSWWGCRIVGFEILKGMSRKDKQS